MTLFKRLNGSQEEEEPRFWWELPAEGEAPSQEPPAEELLPPEVQELIARVYRRVAEAEGQDLAPDRQAQLADFIRSAVMASLNQGDGSLSFLEMVEASLAQEVESFLDARGEEDAPLAGEQGSREGTVAPAGEPRFESVETPAPEAGQEESLEMANVEPGHEEPLEMAAVEPGHDEQLEMAPAEPAQEEQLQATGAEPGQQERPAWAAAQASDVKLIGANESPQGRRPEEGAPWEDPQAFAQQPAEQAEDTRTEGGPAHPDPDAARQEPSPVQAEADTEPPWVAPAEEEDPHAWQEIAETHYATEVKLKELDERGARLLASLQELNRTIRDYEQELQEAERTLRVHWDSLSQFQRTMEGVRSALHRLDQGRGSQG